MVRKPKKKVKSETDPNVMEEVWQEISYTCPIRGKVIQKVKVKKLKPKGDGQDIAVIPDSDITAQIDKETDYGTEDIGE